MRLLLPVLLAVLALPACRAPDDASPDATLARAKNCMNCHAIADKRVGPPFHAVAEKYANDPGAEDRLATKIREGGTGTWGVFTMPPNDVTPDEAKRLAHWVLQQK